MAAHVEPYFIILANHHRLIPWQTWYPCLEITPSNDPTVFARIAERVCAEFGGRVTDRWGGSREGEKEYLWITVGRTTLLLMRKEGLGIGLMGNDPNDIALVSRIAETFDATFTGWRWKLWTALRLNVQCQMTNVQ
jgi:hypothetical protein